MSQAHRILDRLREHLALPWPEHVSARERVVMVVYPPSDERKVRRLLEKGEFEQEVRSIGHGWVRVELATAFSEWLARNEYADRYLRRPDRLWDDAGNVRGLEEYLVEKVVRAASGLTPNDVCALVGCGGLFGLASVSQLIGQVAEQVPGRLVAFFPGELDARTNAYRLLGAKDGWGYLAVPITV